MKSVLTTVLLMLSYSGGESSHVRGNMLCPVTVSESVAVAIRRISNFKDNL